MAQHRITIDNKEYTMPKISADDYMDYLDASETINGSTNAGYKREHIQLMCEWIVRLYDNQFTIEELKDRKKGLSADEIITEFMMVDMDIAGKIQKKMEDIQKNFTVVK
jgi:hypothetical protein|nr:MAG TPA: hypothetical protein [Caudoviricetes sp.]